MVGTKEMKIRWWATSSAPPSALLKSVSLANS